EGRVGRREGGAGESGRGRGRGGKGSPRARDRVAPLDARRRPRGAPRGPGAPEVGSLRREGRALEGGGRGGRDGAFGPGAGDRVAPLDARRRPRGAPRGPGAPEVGSLRREGRALEGGGRGGRVGALGPGEGDRVAPGHARGRAGRPPRGAGASQGGSLRREGRALEGRRR